MEDFGEAVGMSGTQTHCKHTYYSQIINRNTVLSQNRQLKAEMVYSGS